MEMIPDKDLPKMAECEPAIFQVKAGKVYSWCTCGLSETQPFCDHAHRNIEGGGWKSIKVVFDKDEEIYFCQCKKTKTPPFCDDSHLKVTK